MSLFPPKVLLFYCPRCESSYVGFWLIGFQCQTAVMVICPWLSWLIFDFLFKRPSCPFFNSLSLCLEHQIDRMLRQHSEYQVADWGCQCEPGCTSDVLVHWVSAGGFVFWVSKGLSWWTDWGDCRARCCPSLGPASHSVFFSIYHCQETADPSVSWLYLSRWCHLPCCTSHLKINIPQFSKPLTGITQWDILLWYHRHRIHFPWPALFLPCKSIPKERSRSIKANGSSIKDFFSHFFSCYWLYLCYLNVRERQTKNILLKDVKVGNFIIIIHLYAGSTLTLSNNCDLHLSNE